MNDEDHAPADVSAEQRFDIMSMLSRIRHHIMKQCMCV